MNKPRRAKSRRLLPLPLDSEETKCGICLDEVEKRGKIGPCSHLYCFTCLLVWSKHNNTCPQCKLTFRCITKIDFATEKVEEKVFIKDKTLPTGHISSDDDIVYSSEIEDSDPEFIDDTDIKTQQSEDHEPEALFTQRPGKRKRTCVMWSSSEDEEEEVPDMCTKSPDLFRKEETKRVDCNFTQSSKSGCSVQSSPFKSPKSHISPFKSPKSRISPFDSPKSRISPFRSPRYKARLFKSPDSSTHRRGLSPSQSSDADVSPKGISRSVYYTSPKYNKTARWANLDKKVRNNKKRKLPNKSVKRSGIPIPTISSPGNSTGKWLSTSSRKKETPPNKTLRKKFNVPFKKKKNQPEQLFDDPETYFASFIQTEGITLG